MSNLLESRLCEVLGVSRKELRQLRSKRLKNGVHYKKTPQGIVYTEIGEKALKKLLPEAFEKKDPPPENIENFQISKFTNFPKTLPAPLESELEAAVKAAKTPPEIRELKVLSVPRNTRVLNCADAAGASYLVWVRDNQNFVQGMTIKARMLGSRWEYFGNLPRRKGAW